MTPQRNIRKTAATALLVAALAPAAPLAAEEADPELDPIDRLFEELARPDQPGWEQIEGDIARAWEKSGSPAMDLLLQRGRDALEAGDTMVALEHFGALTDHAPDFAEGWNSRATAHFQADQYGLALDAIGRTLALEPRHFGAMVGLATILRELDRPEDALEVLREAHKLHPHRPNVNESIQRLSDMTEGSAL